MRLWHDRIFLEYLKDYILGLGGQTTSSITSTSTLTLTSTSTIASNTATSTTISGKTLSSTKLNQETQVYRDFLVTFIDLLLEGKGYLKEFNQEFDKLTQFCATFKETDKNLYFASALILKGVCYSEAFGTALDGTKAIESFEQALNYGHNMAYQALGDIYSDANDTPHHNCQDSKKAQKYYKTGAELKIPGCLFALFGQCKESDIETSFGYLQQAIDSKYIPALVVAAWSTCVYTVKLKKYLNTHFDIQSALEYLRLMAEKYSTYPDIYQRLSEAYKKQNYEALAKQYLDRALACKSNTLQYRIEKVNIIYCEKGFHAAFEEVRDLLPSDEVINSLSTETKSISEAAKTIVKKNSQVWSKETISWVGAIYEDGGAVEENLYKAYLYYSLGAAMGDLRSIIGQARCLLTKHVELSEPLVRGVVLEIEKAYKVISDLKYDARVTSEGSERVYLESRGIELGLSERFGLTDANRICNVAVNFSNPSPSSIYRMVEWCLSPVDQVDIDVVRAKKYLQILNERHKHSGALCKLGQFALIEAGVKPETAWQIKWKELNDAEINTKNPENSENPERTKMAKMKEAFAYFERAEKHMSCYEARYYLCWMTSNNFQQSGSIGITPDPDRSKQWFLSLEEASERGRIEATFYLAKCLEKGIRFQKDVSAEKPSSTNTLLLFRKYEKFNEQHKKLSEDTLKCTTEIAKSAQKDYHSLLTIAQEKYTQLNTHFMPLYERLRSTLLTGYNYSIDLRDQTILIAEYAYNDEDATTATTAATVASTMTTGTIPATVTTNTAMIATNVASTTAATVASTATTSTIASATATTATPTAIATPTAATPTPTPTASVPATATTSTAATINKKRSKKRRVANSRKKR